MLLSGFCVGQRIFDVDQAQLCAMKPACRGQKDRSLFNQWSQSDAFVTMVIFLRPWARLQIREDEGLHNISIQTQELLNRLVHAGALLSEPLFNTMILNWVSE